MGNNILFVDDEENILKLMRRTFFNSSYNIFLASSAEEGLEIIKKKKIDIVVSDIRMAKMDGFLFFEVLKQSFPETYRIILSGFVDMDLVLKSVINGIAFDYITKPWNKDVLIRKIRDILSLREQFPNKEIIIKLNQLNSFPIEETNLLQIREILKNNNSLEELISLSKNDLFLSTKIIKLINSAFYSENKMGSVTKALNIMGTKGMKDIITHSSLNTIQAMPIFQAKRFSIYNNLISETNKKFEEFYELYYSKPLPDDLELIGLVPFIGKIIILYLYPQQYTEIHNLMTKDRNLSFEEAQRELKYSEFNYINLSLYLLGLWNFPDIYLNLTQNMINPYDAPKNVKELLAILSLAKEYAKSSVNKHKLGSVSYKNDEIISKLNDLISNYNRAI